MFVTFSVHKFVGFTDGADNYDKAVNYLFCGKRATWIDDLTQRINEGLEHAHKATLEESEDGNPCEIFEWLCFWLECHYHNKAPSVLASPAHQQNFDSRGRTMERDRFLDILDALSSQEDSVNNSWTPAPERLDAVSNALSHLSEQTQRIGYVKGATSFCIDDDKMANRSKKLTELGVQRTYQRSGNSGPTLLCTISNETGLLLNSHIILETSPTVIVQL